MIQLQNIHIGYANNVFIQDINASIQPNDFIALTGRNGSGKTTLLKSIAGILPVQAGSILLAGENIQSLSKSELSNKIGYLPSRISHFGSHTVNSFVALGRYSFTNFLGQLKPEDLHIIHQTLKTLHLEALADKKMTELSDGQKQKVCIAQVLVRNCKYLLLDEPLSFLDYETKEEILQFLKDLSVSHALGILISIHDKALVKDYFKTEWRVEETRLNVHSFT